MSTQGVSDAELANLLASLAPQAAPAPPPEWPLKREPLACTVCGEWLDAVHADVGTHPMCDPAPAQAEPPASTVGELAVALVAYEANQPRTRQVAIGPSEIAVPCDRRLAYAMSGHVEQVGDGSVKWARMLGTAVHAMVAEVLAEDNRRLGRERWLIERRVYPDPGIYGSCDAYDTDTDTVIDWKVVGPSSLTKYVRKGPGQQYEGQIQLYGRGWQRAGRTPRWVRIVFLPRSHTFSDAFEWTAPYSRALAESCLDRLFRISELMTNLDVANQPGNWAAIPADPGDACRWCPFLRRGGEADSTGCPGDTATRDARVTDRLTEGLIPSTTRAPSAQPKE